MNIQLAKPIDKYFDISNGIDSAQVKECFTSNATVYDEGGTYQDLASIEFWLQETRKKYQFSAKPISVDTKEQLVIVVAEVSGKFPGSPIKLNYTFVLSGEKIQSLEIA
ncbi:MAG: nuclear transport factor 2 family protein [Alteromonadaceae bacterium]|nr:nuclear transport factor 2 family protein [Alteromonadaceae bacterium]